MSICEECGGVDVHHAVTCSQSLEPLVLPVRPPLPSFEIGEIVVYDWPGEGPVTCMVVSEPDANGEIGLMVLHANVRIHVRDLVQS